MIVVKTESLNNGALRTVSNGVTERKIKSLRRSTVSMAIRF